MTDNTGFSRFWSLYPRHEAKAKAEKIFHTLTKTDPALADTICNALEKQVALKYAHTERKFIPLPTTWLNQARWHDEIEAASSPQPAAASQSRSQYSDAAMLSAYSERFKAQREWIKNHWTKPVDEED